MNFEGHFDDLPTVVTLCAQLTRDLSAIAKFLVASATSLQRCFVANGRLRNDLNSTVLYYSTVASGDVVSNA